ncbi:hypothetical protein T439DRAFT_379809 [Meredithblackwellia eburnea MCA 4105]
MTVEAIHLVANQCSTTTNKTKLDSADGKQRRTNTNHDEWSLFWDELILTTSTSTSTSTIADSEMDKQQFACLKSTFLDQVGASSRTISVRRYLAVRSRRRRYALLRRMKVDGVLAFLFEDRPILPNSSAIPPLPDTKTNDQLESILRLAESVLLDEAARDDSFGHLALALVSRELEGLEKVLTLIRGVSTSSNDEDSKRPVLPKLATSDAALRQAANDLIPRVEPSDGPVPPQDRRETPQQQEEPRHYENGGYKPSERKVNQHKRNQSRVPPPQVKEEDLRTPPPAATPPEPAPAPPQPPIAQPQPVPPQPTPPFMTDFMGVFSQPPLMQQFGNSMPMDDYYGEPTEGSVYGVPEVQEHRREGTPTPTGDTSPILSFGSMGVLPPPRLSASPQPMSEMNSPHTVQQPPPLPSPPAHIPLFAFRGATGAPLSRFGYDEEPSRFEEILDEPSNKSEEAEKAERVEAERREAERRQAEERERERERERHDAEKRERREARHREKEKLREMDRLRIDGDRDRDRESERSSSRLSQRPGYESHADPDAHGKKRYEDDRSRPSSRHSHRRGYDSQPSDHESRRGGGYDSQVDSEFDRKSTKSSARTDDERRSERHRNRRHRDHSDSEHSTRDRESGRRRRDKSKARGCEERGHEKEVERMLSLASAPPVEDGFDFPPAVPPKEVVLDNERVLRAISSILLARGDLKTLCSLALVSKSVSAVVGPPMYQSPRISSPKAANSFFDTISTSLDHSRLVKHLKLRPSSAAVPDVLPTWAAILQVVNLESLDEDISSGDWDITSLQKDYPLTKNSPSRLSELISRRCWWEVGAVHDLLKAQCDLRTLRLTGAVMDREWEGSRLAALPCLQPLTPHLTSLTLAQVMHEDTLFSILRVSGAPLTTLRLGFQSIGPTDDDTPRASIPKALALVGGTLTHLEIRSPGKSSEDISGLLDDVVGVLPRLEVLEFSERGSGATKPVPIASIKFLSSLPKALRVLRARNVVSISTSRLLTMLAEPDSIPVLEDLSLRWSRIEEPGKEVQYRERHRERIEQACRELGIRVSVGQSDENLAPW